MYATNICNSRKKAEYASNSGTSSFLGEKSTRGAILIKIQGGEQRNWGFFFSLVSTRYSILHLDSTGARQWVGSHQKKIYGS